MIDAALAAKCTQTASGILLHAKFFTTQLIELLSIYHELTVSNCALTVHRVFGSERI